MTKEDRKVFGIYGDDGQSRIEVACDQQARVCKINPAATVTQELLAHGFEAFGDEMLTQQQFLIEPAKETLDRVAPHGLQEENRFREARFWCQPRAS